MKKILIRLQIITLVVTLLGYIAYDKFSSNLDISLAKNTENVKENIEKIIDVELPHIAEIESYDNLDRGASSFDVYNYQITFADSLSPQKRQEFEELCTSNPKCSKEDSVYIYEEGNQDEGSIACYISTTKLYIEYMESEDAG